jgi:hypothetical protein
VFFFILQKFAIETHTNAHTHTHTHGQTYFLSTTYTNSVVFRTCSGTVVQNGSFSPPKCVCVCVWEAGGRMLQLSRVRVTAKSSFASSTSGRYQLAEPVCVYVCVVCL